ncbi:DUF6383 domain-containing protein [Parabacteroides sp. PF5-6]|uniref:DUF6383 domain-containing protein n=1 Tax=Parabacteroides sp. PF5-6 TaxID=1742403 RepID=UPI0024068D37|nr:DUF6383 domain-containing protein [Parabacteroides sp. PF5-6]MDF9830223.1 hypothetical protein [Parabacteroides sp. PF5-6]
MNKKFFTLLVALFAMISFGASAQLLEGSAVTSGAYSSTTSYLLKTANGNYLAVDEAGTSLILLDAVPATYAASQRALWYVKANAASAGNPVSLEYTNASNGVKLALNSAVALAADKPAAANANALGGDVEKWTPEGGKTTAAASQALYAIINDGSKVYAMLEADDRVVIVIYNDIAAAVDGAMKVSPFKIKGTAALTANDLNTQFGKAGVYVPNQGIMATNESYFGLTFGTANTEASPFTHTLQAQAVERWEVEYGTEDTPFIPEAGKGTYISMYPKGTLEGDEFAAVRDQSNEAWIALYSKDDEKYLVVDTSYVPGTAQAGNARIQVTTDKLYNAKNATKYRLPESYLFKFMYNADKNSVVIISKGYVKEIATPTANQTNNAAYYSGVAENFAHDDDNAYHTFNPMIKGSVWPNTLAEEARTAINAGTMANEAAYGANQNLVFAKLASSVAYTFGMDAPSNLTIQMSTPAQYKPNRVTTGAYVLKVVGVFDPANKDRVGKYLKMNLVGESEFVTLEKRQNFQEMPSAQWVIETTGTSSYSTTKITNREFASEFYVEFDVEGDFVNRPYFNVGQTYGTETANQFFFLGGDTIAFEKVAAPMDKKLGYKYVDVDNIDLNRYEFRFLHELQMDKPISTLTDKDSAIWVDVNDDAIKFQLVKVADDTYGYTYNDKVLAKLERTAYQLKVYYSSNFEMENRYVTYDAKNKKYYLQEGAAGASVFLMKANNYANDLNYYILLEANTSLGLDLIKVKDIKADANDDNKIKFALDGGKLANLIFDADVTANLDAGKAYVIAGQTKVADENGIPQDAWTAKVFENRDAVDAFIAANQEALYAAYYFFPIPVDGGYLLVVVGGYDNYASTKVAVDNNTLSLTNGEIDDYAWGEVNNSAFKIERDETIIYRTLGVEEDEEEDINIVKFFRMNSAGTGKEYLYEDANSVYSQGIGMNMLGVEGKGMDKNAAMQARYTSGDIMPQYLISLGEEVVPGTDPVLCPECQGLDPNCTHNIDGTEGYITGRFLVNLIDSIGKYEGTAIANDFQWEKKYTRLAFVDGILNMDEDELTILHDQKKFDLTKNAHSPVLFQFRLLEDDSNDFLIESESWKDGKPFAGGIAPTTNGGWVKIQNGVPAIVNGGVSEFAYNEAEIFNLEVTEENPTSNGMIDAAKVDVVAGQGFVTIKGAAGQQVVVANILGQVVANVVLDKNEATIAAPAGVVVVSVNGVATKALVK